MVDNFDNCGCSFRSIFRISQTVLYKNYGNSLGEISLSIAKSYATFSPLFKFSPNFLDIILSLLYKLILFIIAALCVHFFDTIIIPSILYGLYLGATFFVAIARRIQEKNFVTTA